MNCAYCNEDNPPSNKYCGQCGRSLAPVTKRGRSIQAAGWIVIVAGLIILALASLFYAIESMYILWSIEWPWLLDLYGHLGTISGSGVYWPGLTIGALLSVMGLIILAWPKLRAGGAAGKGIRALLLVGGAIITLGAVIGAFPWEIARSLGEQSAQIALGYYSHIYMTIVLIGMTLVLAGAVWAAWRSRSWKLPSAAESDPAAEGDKAGQ